MKIISKAETEKTVIELKERVFAQIEDTQYSLILFDYSRGFFGNVIVDLKRKDSDDGLRFVSDRGDIYVSRLVGGRWEEAECYPHLENDRNYALLLKAIEDFVK
ncbi:MAG: hypothetical protein FWD39_04385 [Clostridiales bacterium]|nr:hypothetical protein [Clostridiales bacterium]